MRSKQVAAITATKTRTVVDLSAYVSPFLRGQEVVLMLVKDNDFAGGDVTLETDNATDGSYSDIRAAADADAATTQCIEFFNVTLGDNLAYTAAAVTAGGFEIRLLGDS